MLRTQLRIVTFVVTGCFNPTYNNPSCGPAGECPSGLVCSAGACVSSIIGGDGGGGADATTVDTFVIDAPAACTQWTPHFFSPCLIGSPNGPVSLTAGGVYTYNTSTGTLIDPSSVLIAHATFTVDQTGAPAWGMNVSSFVVAAGVTLRVIGTKPLIIASWGSIEIDGAIDVGSSTQTMTTGAGSNPTLCGSSIGGTGQDAMNNTPGSAGGGGGGFDGPGGTGGQGNKGVQGGAGGIAAAAPRIVRGGCSGGNSGRAGNEAVPPANQNSISNGGAGGGAIELTAQTSLTIKGTINAGGGGGAAGVQGSADGGGGGGGGGFIGLEGGTLVLQSGVLAANGGGGGGTAGVNQPGNSGGDGQPSTTAAQGGPPPGVGSQCNGVGGTGGANTLESGGSGGGGNNNMPCGGPGGGGSTGYLMLFSSQITQNVTTQSPTGLINYF